MRWWRSRDGKEVKADNQNKFRFRALLYVEKKIEKMMSVEQDVVFIES